MRDSVVMLFLVIIAKTIIAKSIQFPILNLRFVIPYSSSVIFADQIDVQATIYVIYYLWLLTSSYLVLSFHSRASLIMVLALELLLCCFIDIGL
jgi:hypothetical protein